LVASARSRTILDNTTGAAKGIPRIFSRLIKFILGAKVDAKEEVDEDEDEEDEPEDDDPAPIEEEDVANDAALSNFRKKGGTLSGNRI
jgi:hypothetical protein